MTDKGFWTFIKVLFGLGGITIILIACTRTMAVSDTFLVAFVGLMGLSYSTITPLKSILTKLGNMKNHQITHCQEK